MAHVTFKEGQPIQSLSGTVGRLTFRTVNGKTFVREKRHIVLPKKPTRQQLAMVKRQDIIDCCVAQIQKDMNDMVKAMEQYKKIYNRCAYLYKKYCENCTTTFKKKECIKYIFEHFSAIRKGNVETMSVHSRN